MKIKNILVYILLLFSINILSQTGNKARMASDIFSSLAEPSLNSGKVIVIQDDQIKVLVNRYVENRRKSPTYILKFGASYSRYVGISG